MSANKKIANSHQDCKYPLLTIQVQRKDNNTHYIYLRSKPAFKPHKGAGCNDPSTSLCDQWHLRRDAATIQRNTCELRYLKQRDIKSLRVKLT